MLDKKNKIEEKKERDNTRREFLLTFFNQTSKEYYEEKKLNGFWLVKHWNDETKRWQVSIYRQEKFKKYKQYKESILKI